MTVLTNYLSELPRNFWLVFGLWIGSTGVALYLGEAISYGMAIAFFIAMVGVALAAPRIGLKNMYLLPALVLVAFVGSLAGPFLINSTDKAASGFPWPIDALTLFESVNEKGKPVFFGCGKVELIEQENVNSAIFRVQNACPDPKTFNGQN